MELVIISKLKKRLQVSLRLFYFFTKTKFRTHNVHDSKNDTDSSETEPVGTLCLHRHQWSMTTSLILKFISTQNFQILCASSKTLFVTFIFDDNNLGRPFLFLFIGLHFTSRNFKMRQSGKKN